MAYIYIIKNDINDKVYIGKTLIEPQKRFIQHCCDSKKRRCEKRPLYNAMRKYGAEHFWVEIIEETEDPEQREIYWISHFNSYKYGYNATIGGEGKRYIDAEPILQLYNQIHNQKEIAKILNISETTVNKVLKEHNIKTVKSPTQIKGVKQIKDGKTIETFSSCTDAAKYLVENNCTNGKINTVLNKITDCARHERKTAYGFNWEFL